MDIRPFGGRKCRVPNQVNHRGINGCHPFGAHIGLTSGKLPLANLAHIAGPQWLIQGKGQTLSHHPGSIGLFVAAWKGRSVTSMDTNSVKGKLMVDACCAAPSALVFGFCLVRTIQYFDSLSFIATILFGACLVADLVYTRYEVRRLAANVIAKEAATQFLWSCVFFGMLSFCLGMALSGWNWLSTGFMRAFNLLFWSAMTGIGIYPVFRNAKRLAGAVGPRQ